MATIHIHRDMHASQDRVFAALDDHASMGRWLGPKVSVIRQGHNGLGTIRRINAGLSKIDEEVFERTAPSKMAYRIVAGVPGLVHHRGDISVSPRGESASAIDWQIELELKVPGLAQLLGVALKQSILKGLARLDRQLS